MPTPTVPAMPNMFVHNAHVAPQYANMPFMHNPYFNTFRIPQMPWNMPGMNNMYMQPSIANNHEQNEIYVNLIPTPKVKVDLISPRTEVKKGKKNKKSA